MHSGRHKENEMVTGAQSLTTNDIKIEIKSNEEMQ